MARLRMSVPRPTLTLTLRALLLPPDSSLRIVAFLSLLAMQPAPLNSRPFEVVVWGSTGFTGKLVAEYLGQ